jgi:DNA repair protein RadC
MARRTNGANLATLSYSSRARHGTDGVVPVNPHEVAKRRLEPSVGAINRVPNHPSGDPEPSSADIAITKETTTAVSEASDRFEDAVNLLL